MYLHKLEHKKILDQFWKFIHDNFPEFEPENIQKTYSVGSDRRCVISLLNNNQTANFVGTPTIRLTFYTPLINNKIDFNWYESISDTLFTALENNFDSFKNVGIADIAEPVILDPFVDNFSPNESAQVFQFNLITS
jgi:hypothetical protein